MKYTGHSYLIAFIVLCFSQSYAQKKKPIVIEDQGSFAVGGTVKTNPGTFDPIKRGLEGQTFHGEQAWRRCYSHSPS